MLNVIQYFIRDTRDTRVGLFLYPVINYCNRLRVSSVL